jgi:uncharacterized protein YeaO (DUF488 family)
LKSYQRLGLIVFLSFLPKKSAIEKLSFSFPPSNGDGSFILVICHQIFPGISIVGNVAFPSRLRKIKDLIVNDKKLIEIRRVYEDTGDAGVRILVDGLWPRGIRKEKIDIWMKDIAPSKELREWYAHDPSKCDEFRKRYTLELKKKGKLVSKIIEMSRSEKVILLYSTSSKCSNASVLLEYLRSVEKIPAKN